jgi:hypothetical protein
MLSKLPPPVRFIVLNALSKSTLVFVPWNFGLSKSSLLVCVISGA